MKKFLSINKGLTIVETLVAISILSLSIAATFTAVQSGIKLSTMVKDQITAFYLGQEGMEFIRNVRDENALRSINSLASGGSAVSWLNGLAEISSDPCYFGNTCVIDSYLGIHNGGAVACSGGFGSCPNIKEDSTTGLFGYTNGWPDTSFKREIQFQSVTANEVLITIRVSWMTRGVNKSFQITESLFNH